MPYRSNLFSGKLLIFLEFPNFLAGILGKAKNQGLLQ